MNTIAVVDDAEDVAIAFDVDDVVNVADDDEAMVDTLDPKIGKSVAIVSTDVVHVVDGVVDIGDDASDDTDVSIVSPELNVGITAVNADVAFN